MGLSRNGYIAQLVIFMKNDSFESAYKLASEFASSFPDDMTAHYLLSVSAFRTERIEESAAAARKAFNLSQTKEDMANCALRACIAYLRLGQYDKGLEMIGSVEADTPNIEMEQLAFLMSAAKGDEAGTDKHLKLLISIDIKKTEEFLETVIGKEELIKGLEEIASGTQAIEGYPGKGPGRIPIQELVESLKINNVRFGPASADNLSRSITALVSGPSKGFKFTLSTETAARTFVSVFNNWTQRYILDLKAENSGMLINIFKT